MPKAFWLLLSLTSAAGCAFSQPFIPARGIVNTGSYMAPGLPGGSIARGSVFSIFGRNLGPATLAQAPSYPLANALAGVSITVSQGGLVLNAIPIAVSAGQINAIMPSNAPMGTSSVTVTFNGPSNPAPVNIVNSAFGIYAANGGGFGPGILQNFNSQTDQPVNALSTAAKPGQAITLWGTGLGPVSYADAIQPTAGDLPTRVEIFVGGKLAPKLYSGRSGFSGTDQIVFTIPNDAPLGCWVPVQIRTEGSVVSNAVTMAISPDGSPCSEPGNVAGQKFIAGGTLGLVGLVRTSVRGQFLRAANTDLTEDSSLVQFRQERSGAFAFNPIFSLPPAGTCTVYTVTGDPFGFTISGSNTTYDSLPGTAPTIRYLDAGPRFSAGGVAGRKNYVPPPAPMNAYWLKFLGKAMPNTGPSTLILDPGAATVSGSGGKDVPVFQLNATMPAVLNWMNRDQISTVDRRQNLTLNWSGAPGDQSVIVIGGNTYLPANATGVFVCVAAPGATFITIPPQALANVPATGLHKNQSRGGIYAGAFPLSSPILFNATGVDAPLGFAVGISGKEVIFQ